MPSTISSPQIPPTHLGFDPRIGRVSRASPAASFWESDTFEREEPRTMSPEMHTMAATTNSGRKLKKEEEEEARRVFLAGIAAVP